MGCNASTEASLPGPVPVSKSSAPEEKRSPSELGTDFKEPEQNGLKEIRDHLNSGTLPGDILEHEMSDEGDLEQLDQEDRKSQAEAATRIQATFRGHLIRKQMRAMAQGDIEPPKDNKNEEVDIDLEDPDVKNAASKIQASFRGHQARKQQKKGDDSPSPKESSPSLEDELAGINLEDPELNKAATRIQATFRGHITRKQAQVVD